MHLAPVHRLVKNPNVRFKHTHASPRVTVSAIPPVAFPETSRRDQSSHVKSQLKRFAVSFTELLSSTEALGSAHAPATGCRGSSAPRCGSTCVTDLRSFEEVSAETGQQDEIK